MFSVACTNAGYFVPINDLVPVGISLAIVGGVIAIYGSYLYDKSKR